MKNILIKLPLLFIAFSFIISCGFNTNSSSEVETEELSPGVDGVLKKYRKNKTLLSTIEHKDGKRHGISRLYYEDGKTIHNEICYKMGKKHGLTKSFYSDGSLYYTVNYNEGKRDGIMQKYYSEGMLMAEVPYEKGVIMPGLVEYQKTGEQKTIYPKLVFQEIDKTVSEYKYVVRMFFEGKKNGVTFFNYIYDDKGEKIAERYLPVDKNGVAEVVFYLRKGGEIDRKLSIRAEYKTFLGNIYVVQKEKRIKVKK